MWSKSLIFILSAAQGKKETADHAIVFLDEIDKIAKHGLDDYIDASSDGVQQDLLSVIDGGEFFYEPDHDDYSRKKFDCSNLLFIFGGAFNRLRNNDTISQEDLVKFGFIPEFANRLGNILRLDPLSGEVIKNLVRREVEEYSNYLVMGVDDMNVYTEIIHSIILIDKSYEEMGGRCVGSMVRRFFEDRMFEIDKKKMKNDGKEKG
ncbi:MAG: endopeptidase Clp ATP-binding regulatory subunit (clpX) [Candidatus Saganbacteria bacterium]|uniref:Endopeptidase Clp ATP-binding regulatory subunit (ClpX) n=1 Tax=Candidatus Saganbacteria bacterium TaxID=2575572 RepID=A0A833P2S1_UNCSA|nr:MAG: endopeptidase Clp ATP-binding regulatory subunit (clpX) [Candidatus Saganbacteria bacterium]